MAKAGFPKPPKVLPHIQNAFAMAFDGFEESEPKEELISFLRECQGSDLSNFKSRELKRILRGAWISDEFDELGLLALRAAEQDPKAQTAKAAILGYLLHFPAERDAMSTLAMHCQKMTDEVVPQFQERASQFSLFDPAEAPAAIGRAMIADNRNPICSACEQAGLGTTPFATRLGEKAFEAACSAVAGLKADGAMKPQSEIMELFKDGEAISNQAGVACALLEPWVEGSPSAGHRKRISAFLVKAIGDPRLQSSRWKFIESEMQELSAEYMPSAIVDVLKRWLTEAAMRTFFQAIAKTTDRPGQWKTRSDFWLAYLDGGWIEEAWPALGPRARDQISTIVAQQEGSLEHGKIDDPSLGSSALIFKIGDLTIAEWSDNGYCRFWSPSAKDAPNAPEPYQPSYNKKTLRAMNRGEGFKLGLHDSHGRWCHRFAKIIFDSTGVEHPNFGRGY